MYKLLILVTLQFICLASIKGQEFMFSMVFMDTLGNSHTLVLGYDEHATEGLDSQFAEIDILSTPWDSVFDVRITSELRPGDAEPIQNFHSKTQIIEKNCSVTYPPPIEIDIKAIHWPVTATWDPLLFRDSCNEGSLITSIPQGGWWDVASPSDLDHVELKSAPMVQFSDNVDFYSNGNVNPNYAYQDSMVGLISVFWIGLGKAELGVSTRQYNLYPNLQISPNPVYDHLSINGISLSLIERIEIFSIQGEKILEAKNDEVLFPALAPGIYILSIGEKNGNRINTKFVKM